MTCNLKYRKSSVLFSLTLCTPNLHFDLRYVTTFWQKLYDTVTQETGTLNKI